MNQRKLIAACTGIALCAISAARPSIAHAQSPEQTTAAAPDDLARADELYRQGNAAYDAGKYDEAYRLYEQAFATKKSFDIAGNLGQAAFKLGKYTIAAEHLAYSISIFPPNGNPTARAKTTELFAEARKHVGIFRVHVNIEGASVRIDGVEVGRSPIDKQIFVEPGPRSVEARKDGFKTATRQLTAQAGQSVAFGLDLEKDERPVVPPPTEDKPIWPAALLGSLGGAALITGVSLTIAAELEYGSVEDDSNTCQPPTSICQTGGQDALDDVALYHNVGFAMYGVAAAAALGLGIYLAVPAREPAEGSDSALTIVPAPGGAVLKGRF